jgi:hypothetical protein
MARFPKTKLTGRPETLPNAPLETAAFPPADRDGKLFGERVLHRKDFGQIHGRPGGFRTEWVRHPPGFCADLGGRQSACPERGVDHAERFP